MAKTWETLFNLTSFMKYLLTEVLPEEKLESPVYVVDSLHELLTVTVACIKKIKSISNKDSLLKEDSSLHEILPCRNNGKTERYVKNILKTDTKSVINLTEKKVPKEEHLNYSSAINLEDKCDSISENFIKLNQEMHNGRPFGYYCRPCDNVFHSKKLWEKHNADKLHIFLKQNCETKHASCSYCNLIVFSTFDDAEFLFGYHQKDHYELSSEAPEITTVKLDKIKQLIDGAKSLERMNHSSDKVITISSVFIELDKLMHSENGRGFYCHTCDKSFDTVTRWNKHFQDENAHINTTDASDCFQMCDKCRLIIFADPSVQIVYKTYHDRGHSYRDDNKIIKSIRSSSKSSIENIHLTSQNQNGQERSSRHEVKGRRNKLSSNSYVISEQFMNFDTTIHSNNLQGCYYCRPCNATLSPDDWGEHSSDKKHQRLMASRNFVNWKGTCTYCSLTLIGTRDTIKNYMVFHNKAHKLVLSYDEERISIGRVPRRSTNKGIFSNSKRHSRSNSVSTVGGDEDEDEYEEEDDEDEDNEDVEESENKPVPLALDSSNTESSWYSSSKEEQQHFLVFKLVNSRLAQKQKSGTTDFGALCMPCEITVENAFSWQEHLFSQDHRQNVSNNDRQALIKDLNVSLFGNGDVLEKYSTVIKGNTIFIDT